MKRSTGTRWSAKYSAIHALCLSFSKVKDVLVFLQSDDCPQHSEESKFTAQGLLKKLCKFETIFILKLWDKILHKFDKVNISLQKMGLDLSVTVKLFSSLVLFLENLNTEYDTIFNECESWFNQHVLADTSLNTILQNIQTHRTRSRSRSESNATRTLFESYRKSIFLPIIKQLLAELKIRSKIYTDLFENFDFLVRLNDLNMEQIATSCKKVSEIYKKDVSEIELINECEMAKHYFFLNIQVSNSESELDTTTTHASFYTTIVKDKLSSTFPNIEILLRIYLCLFVTNVTDERSFSKLKYIKNYLRNSLTDHKLNSLSLMCIERNILETIDFNEIIDTFISSKIRRVNIEQNE